ncbi:MAG: hypothetical protein RR012_02535 [Oscillospiraceae bacterium]
MFKEKILSKVSVYELVWWWIFRLIVISPLIFGWDSPHENITLQILANFVITFAWEIMQLFPEKSFIRKISPRIQNFTVVQVFLTSFLGAFKDFYYTVWWWDSIIHVVGGAICMAVGYEIFTALQIKYKVYIPIGILIFGAFGFSFFAGTVWEIFEFLFDQLTGSDSQHWCYANADGAYSIFSYTPERFPVMDTMIDTICNTVGAFIFTIFLKIKPYHHDGDNDVNKLFKESLPKE